MDWCWAVDYCTNAYVAYRFFLFNFKMVWFITSKLGFVESFWWYQLGESDHLIPRVFEIDTLNPN